MSSALWHKSGRVETMGSELYKLNDRKGSEYILAPTFEEEITKLVGEEVHSWRNLPVKVYQTSRKYRDEPRPRNGLLRTREFLMKDLYTFDADIQGAEKSYKEIRNAYDAIMTRIFGVQGTGWKIAEADTGAMGGAQSHEYQVPDDVGEDELFMCSDCSYTANGELATSLSPSLTSMPETCEDLQVLLYGSKDLLAHECTMTAVVIPRGRTVNETKLARHLSKEDGKALSTHAPWDWNERPEGPMIRFDNLQILLDSDCMAAEVDEIGQAILQAVEAFIYPDGTQAWTSSKTSNTPILSDYFQQKSSSQSSALSDPITTSIVNLRQAQANDTCSSCRIGTLQRIKSIEVGHTFLLGTRYSDSLGYQFVNRDSSKVPFQMGCYGIGITRIMGVLAQLASKQYDNLKTATKKVRRGFVWNRNVAPFTAIILPINLNEKTRQAANIICKGLQRSKTIEGVEGIKEQDIAIDDRTNLSMGVRMSDADLLGSPLFILLGDRFEKTGEVEIRHRTESGVQTINVPLTHFTST